MHKIVGLRLNGSPSIAEILYFDVIAVVSPPRSQGDADSIRRYYEEKGHTLPSRIIDPADDSQQQLFRKLRDQGVIAEVSSLLTSQDARDAYNVARDHNNKIADEIIQIVYGEERPAASSMSSTQNAGKPGVACAVRQQFEDIFMRPYRQMLQANTDCLVTSVVPEQLGDSLRSGDPVLEVVINRFPTPRPDTSFEAVLEFRSDEDAMRALRRLRQWMAKIAKAELTPHEIDAELQDLIDQYTEYMNLHKLKFYHGAFQSLVSISLEVLEHLAKVKLKSALEAVLSFKSRRLALTEAELKAPGREAAYIVQSAERVS